MEPVHYKVGEEDQIAFSILHFYGGVPRFLMLAVSITVLLAVLGFLFDGIVGASSVTFGGVFGIGIMLCLTRFVFVPRFAKRAWRDFALIQEPVELTLRDDGFDMSQPSAHVDALWHNMLGWNEDARVFAIYVTRHQAYILPKAAFEAPQIDFARAQLVDSGLVKKGVWRK